MQFDTCVFGQSADACHEEWSGYFCLPNQIDRVFSFNVCFLSNFCRYGMLERLLCDNFPIEPGPSSSRASEQVKCRDTVVEGNGKSYFLSAKVANAIWMTINNALHKHICEESMDKWEPHNFNHTWHSKLVQYPLLISDWYNVWEIRNSASEVDTILRPRAWTTANQTECGFEGEM
jgi:hypothetical protein